MAAETIAQVKKVDRLSETRVRLSVEVAQDQVDASAKKVVNSLQQKAKIPGFRPGKAPVDMVKKRYQEQIEQDVVSKLLEEGLSHAVREAKLFPINRPKVDIKQSGFNGKKGLVFDAEYEVRPEIKLKDYKGIPLEMDEIKVSEKELEISLNGLRERFGTLEPTEKKKVSKGDFAVAKVAIEMQDGDKKKEEPKEFTLEVGENKLLPELEKGLSGMDVGSKKEIDAVFPKDYSEKHLAGRKVKFNCELLEIKKRVLPELNDDFAKQISGGKDLKTLKDELKNNLLEEKKNEQSAEQRKQLLDHLVAKHKFEVPASMVVNRMKSLVQQVEEDMKRKGQAFPELSEDEVKLLKEQAEKQVRGSLLLAELSVKEKIQLDEKQVETRVQALATQMNKTPEEAMKWLEGKGYITQIREDVLTDQVFGFLADNAVTKTPKAKK